MFTRHIMYDIDMLKKCKICGKSFRISTYRKETAKYCSKLCQGKAYSLITGKKHHNWKGGTCKHSLGYLLIKRPEHPYADASGYIPQHRLVIEKKLGRIVNPRYEDVHHINGDRKDNRIRNLILLSRQEHSRVEAGWEKVGNEWWKTCNGCMKFLCVTTENFYHQVDRSVQSGVRPMALCKECSRKRRKLGYRKHKEKKS